MKSFAGTLARWGTRPPAEVDAAAQRLLEEARAARKLRGYRLDPDVAALTIEHTRERVERVLLIAMTCGLLYTTVNVQGFVAGAAEAWTLAWMAAWLVEPFVTTGVLALLRIEQVARRNQVIPGGWVRWTRWAAFAVTYLFNTWRAWGSGNAEEIIKHSAIPILVFFFAEALTDGRDALTEAALRVAERRDAVTEPIPLPPVAPIPPVAATPRVSLDKPIGRELLDVDTAQDIRPPKGWLKEVAIPNAYRELAAEVRARGGSLDEISLAEIDRRAGTSKYVTKAMVAPLRAQLEAEEEVDDGVRV